jgi:general secretion pathway protein F
MSAPSSMQHFHYKAVGPSGAVVRGELEAPDRAAAAARLHASGHVPLAVEAAPPASGLRRLLTREIGGGRRAGPRLASELMGRLALLLEAGVALEASLALLAGSEGAAGTREQAKSLLRRLRAGSGLADAMAAEGSTFSPVVVALVRAGEASGSLAPALAQIAAYLARAEAVRQSVRSALIYPVILLATAAATVLLVLLVVLPQLEPVVAEAGARLPLLTRLAFAASHLVRDGWWAMLALAGVFVLSARRVLADPGVRARLDALLLRAPVLGLALRRAESGRFARVLGALVAGGVALPSALVLAHPVLANRVFAQAVTRIIGAVREGGGLAGPLARAGIFPELAVQMVRIGEATGRLDTILIRLADLLESDVQRTLDRALVMLVPALTILLGALVAGIIASVMMAVLSVGALVR